MNRPVNYEQTDSRWRNVTYSDHNDRSQTIGTSGCGPTCAAMVIATLRDKTVTPVETCAWAVKNGYRTYNNGTKWAYFKAQMAAYGLVCDDYITDAARAVEAVKSGYMVIALALKGLWTSGGHYILAYGVEGDNILINDPNSARAARERAPLSTFKSQCGKFWIVRHQWRDANMEIKKIKIQNSETKQHHVVEAVNINGSNYVNIRDLEKPFRCEIGNVGATPTFKLLDEEGVDNTAGLKALKNKAATLVADIEKMLK